MTVKEYAASRGVSRQAVYNAITKAGLKTDKLTAEDGQLSEEGIKRLNELVKGKSVERTKDNLQKTVQEQKEVIDRLSKSVENLTEIVSSLTEDVDRLTKMLEQANTNTSQAQQITAMINLSRQPFLKRLFSGHKES